MTVDKSVAKPNNSGMNSSVDDPRPHRTPLYVYVTYEGWRYSIPCNGSHVPKVIRRSKLTAGPYFRPDRSETVTDLPAAVRLILRLESA